jgi:uncharacterized repeat protein (TIGR01451 family)
MKNRTFFTKHLLLGVGLIFGTTFSALALNGAHFTINRISAPYFIVDGNQPTTLTKAYIGFEIVNNSNSATTYSNLVFAITSVTSSVTGQNYTVLSPTSGQFAIGTLAPGQSRVCYFFVSYPSNVTPIGTFNVRLSDNTASDKTQAFQIRNRSSISANAGGLATQSFANQDLLGGIVTDDVTYTVGNARTNDEVDFQISVAPLFDPNKLMLLSTQVISSTLPTVTVGRTDSLYYVLGANGGTNSQVTIRWTFKIVGFNFKNYFLPCSGATSGSTNYKYQLNTNLGANGDSISISSTANKLFITKTSNKTVYQTCETATFTIAISNPGAYDASIDSLTDEIPASFSYQGPTAASNITNAMCTKYPAVGSTGELTWVGGIQSGGNTSFYVPAGQTIYLIYTATAGCSPTGNLTTTSSGYVGTTEFDQDQNTVKVSVPLPVQWLGIAAKKKGTGIDVSWRTAEEIDVDRFEVERSSNGGIWESLAAIDPRGTGNSVNDYSYFDGAPVKGQNTYRIREVSTTGKISFSRIVMVNTDEWTDKLLVYPNPTPQQTVQVRMEEAGLLEVYNNLGALVYKGRFPIGLHTIQLPGLPAGNYRLRTGTKQTTLLIQ